MAGKGAGRSGSAGQEVVSIPHVRIENDKAVEEWYSLGARLGQGSFGVVKEVTHLQTKEKWACKAVNKEKAGSSAIQLLEREVSILKRVRHEHIIRLKEVLESPKRMYLVMELCEDGELADVLAKQHHFSEMETKTIMSRLASAISYLHKNDMVHRDIKLENILLSKNPQDSSDHLFIKVTDFGLSVVKGGVGTDNMLMDLCGTPMYMAPEIIDNKTYSEKCDVWAMGIIMYNLLCGLPPFHSKDEESLYEIIKTANIDFTSNDIWKEISKEAQECITYMLRVDPAHRYSASEVLDHPWITGENNESRKNVLEMMKEWAPDLKNTDDSVEENTVNGASSSNHVTDSGSEGGGSRAGSASSPKRKGSADSRRSSYPQSVVNNAARKTNKVSSPAKPAVGSTKGTPRSTQVTQTGGKSKTKSPVPGHSSTKHTPGGATNSRSRTLPASSRLMTGTQSKPVKKT